LRLDDGAGAAWALLIDGARDAEARAAARALAAELAERPTGGAQPWLALAQLTDDLESILDALTRACEREPRLLDAHDARARLLVAAGRFGEAAAACRPSVFGDDIPVELQARAAWVARHAGDVDGAIDSLRAICRDNPGYAWAHRALADIYFDTERIDELSAHARDMPQRLPGAPLAHVIAGRARAARGDLDGAIEAHRRALALDPRCRLALTHLLEAYLERGEPALAASTLAEVRDGFGAEDPEIQALALRVRLVQRTA